MAGALVIGQFVGADALSVAALLVGVGAWFLLVGLALLFAGGTRDG